MTARRAPGEVVAGVGHFRARARGHAGPHFALAPHRYWLAGPARIAPTGLDRYPTRPPLDGHAGDRDRRCRDGGIFADVGNLQSRRHRPDAAAAVRRPGLAGADDAARAAIA